MRAESLFTGFSVWEKRETTANEVYEWISHRSHLMLFPMIHRPSEPTVKNKYTYLYIMYTVYSWHTYEFLFAYVSEKIGEKTWEELFDSEMKACVA